MKLRNSLIAAAIVIGFSSPAIASETFNTSATAKSVTEMTDANQIADWSKTKIDILLQNNILVGYPDGSFRPNENLTREEFAVALYNALVTLDSILYNDIIRLSNQMWDNDYYLYDEILYTQWALLSLAQEVDVLNETLAKKDNWVGISVQYTPDRDDDTSETTVELNGKVQVIKLNDTFAISVRPFVNTNTEFGGAVSVDADLSDKIELWTGIGVAYRADQGTLGSITGNSDNAIPYAEVGVSLDLSDKTGVYVVGKAPFNSSDSKEPVVGAGLKLNF